MSDFEKAEQALEHMKALKPSMADTLVMCRANPESAANVMMLLGEKLEQALEKLLQCASAINTQHERIEELTAANAKLEADNASLRAKLV